MRVLFANFIHLFVFQDIDFNHNNKLDDGAADKK